MPNLNYLTYGGDFMLFSHTGSTVQPMAFSTSAKLTINMGTREISSRDSGDWKEIAAGKFDWNISSDQLLNFVSTGTTQSYDEMFKYMTAKCSVCINFAHKTGSSPSWTVDATKKKLSGTGYITSLDINSADGDQATYSVNIMGSSALSIS